MEPAPLRVLVVDDDPAVLDTLSRGLAARAVEVDAFGDTNKALRHLDSGRYDAVIADQVLPGGLCGHEFLLAAQQVDPEVKTILLSGHDLAHRDLPLERLDATASKPVTPTQLLSLIAELKSDEPLAARGAA